MLGASDAFLEGTSDGILEGSALGLSLGPTNGETLGTEEGIILSSSDGEVLGTTIWAAYGITIGLDEGTELGSSDGSSDGSNELVLGSDEGIVSFQINLFRQFPAPCTVLQFCSILQRPRRRPRLHPCPRPHPRRHPTPYVAVVPLVSVLAVMYSSSSLQLFSPCPSFFVFGEGSVTCAHLYQIVRVGRYY